MMYRSSARYKDACEVGKIEYAASYRTLLWWVMIRQDNIALANKLIEEGYTELILMGAGDLCDLFLREISGTKINLAGIIEDNIKKYGSKYKKNNICCLADVSLDFLEGKKIIVMYRDKFNTCVEQLQNKGVKIEDIISIEELMSYILYKERA